MSWLFGLKLSDVCLCVFRCECSEVWYGVYVDWLNFTRPRDILFFFLIFNFKSGIYNFSHNQEYSILLGISQNSRNLIWDIPILRKFGIMIIFLNIPKNIRDIPKLRFLVYSAIWEYSKFHSGHTELFLIRDIVRILE